MRILYLASNPGEQVSLALEREMTELQRRLMAVDRLGTIVFKPLPHLKIDELSTVITEFRPDVVHLSVHGRRGGVVFADGDDEKFVAIPHFVAHFKAVRLKPKLVYLSACEGDRLAKALSEMIPFVIAMTDKVTNEGAIRSAVKFYEWLGGGSTIQEAYDISRPLLETVDEGAVSSNLYTGKDYSADSKLVDVFRMMACFTKLENTRRKKKPPLLKVRDLCDQSGNFEIEAGFVGCLRDTQQLIMFSTDDTFVDQEAIDAGEDWIESQMTWLLREPPVGGEIWFEHQTIDVGGRLSNVRHCRHFHRGMYYRLIDIDRSAPTLLFRREIPSPRRKAAGNRLGMYQVVGPESGSKGAQGFSGGHPIRNAAREQRRERTRHEDRTERRA